MDKELPANKQPRYIDITRTVPCDDGPVAAIEPLPIHVCKQGSGSPKRRSSWTKHTSYPTLQNEEAVHVPAEISAATRAQIRHAERRLDASTKRLDNIQRKNLSQMDSQRKILEKSMLAYSEKMKDIITSRANELFREIRTRNSSRDDRIVKSPTASLKSYTSLPGRLITKKHSESRSLQGFPQVQVYSPIAERSAECSPVSRSHTFHIADNNFSKPFKHSKLKRASDTKDNESCSVQTEHGTSLSEKTGKVKAIPRVVVTSSIPWLKNDQYDSAYSSASEELDRDFSDTASDASDRTSTSAYVKQNILTVPVVHVRKNRKNRRKGKGNTVNARKVTAPHINHAESSILLNT